MGGVSKVKNKSKNMAAAPQFSLIFPLFGPQGCMEENFGGQFLSTGG